MDKLTSVTYNDGTPNSSYTYNANGQLTQSSNSSVTNNYLTFDGDGRVTSSNVVIGGVTANGDPTAEMSLTSTQAAEVLYPLLSVFHVVQGYALKSVRQVFVEGALERLAFDFGSVLLTVRADENDDTVHVSVLPSDQGETGEDVSDGQPWRELIGRSFGWGWLIMNQQGYIDGLLISFDSVEPQVLLNVIASSIKVSRITRAGPMG